ncbi:MAG: hypothetical protein WC377_04590 [Bacteroidales bacterium]|nr:hypothetical protein [Bacteroidales bacterium]MDD2825165.1 hypothetical protein [Bacteroidales bacterium]MDD3101005.1 hypothetical protein [Bacteroidales bacterium]MDD3639840.1 hypothetical protein [Bacteroidales bacterium]MDD3944539.1 hypothetical protein [Bacteroidales bacterium]
MRRPKADYSEDLLGVWALAADSPLRYYLYGDYLVMQPFPGQNDNEESHIHHHRNWELTIRKKEMLMEAYRGFGIIPEKLAARRIN